MSLTTGKADLSGLRIDHDRRDSNSSSGSKKKIVMIVAAAIMVALAAFYIFRNTIASAIEVEAGTVTLTYPSAANAVLTASGYVVAQQKASIASKATGRLVYLGVEEGDKVARNQIIARIEDQDVMAALEQAKANLQLAKADLQDAAQWVERQKQLLASNLASEADLVGAQARYRRVEASIKAAEANVQAADVAVENTRIRAPFDGTVLTKNANVGEVVAPFAASAGSRGAVVTVADMRSLEVEADVSESNITRVEAGGPCEIVLDAYPDQRYQGYVHKIVPTADRAKATVLTKVRFTNRDERVLPEMSAKVTFLSPGTVVSENQSQPQLTVPATAITTRDEKPVVLLIEGDKIRTVQVHIGERYGERIVIKEGLAQGEKVVLRPSPDLTDGSKIKIKS